MELGESKRVYQKTGGRSQALEDFYLFEPIYVRRNKDRMYGLVGEYELRLVLKSSRSGDKPEPEAMMVFTRKQNGYKPKEQSRTIEYMSGGAQ